VIADLDSFLNEEQKPNQAEEYVKFVGWLERSGQDDPIWRKSDFSSAPEGQQPEQQPEQPAEKQAPTMVNGYGFLYLENKYYAAINILAELYGDGSEKASTSKGSGLNKLLSKCESLNHQGKKMICIYSLLCNINNNSDGSRYEKTDF